VILLTVRPEEITMPAKYVRVAEAIRDQIRSGQLLPGEKLPSTAELITRYSVSYSSIRSAMLVLKAEGWVEGRQGEGVFVAPRPPTGDGEP
jgi:GntR family transcriptional regulator